MSYDMKDMNNEISNKNSEKSINLEKNEREKLDNYPNSQ